MSPVYGVQLRNASGSIRALVVQALREKAAADRDAAGSLGDAHGSEESSEQREGYNRVAGQLLAQADQAEMVADELEGA